MVTAVRSDPPTFTLTADPVAQWVLITITNPTPTSGRPAVLSNRVWRRETGSTGPWTAVGYISPNGSAGDLYAKAGTAYDYFVRTDSGSDSATQSIATPPIRGMRGYVSGDSKGTFLNSLVYTDGAVEAIGLAEAVQEYVGRTYPVVEFGIQEAHTVALNITIPYSDATYLESVDWWRRRKREKQPIYYADGRGRAFYGQLVGPITLTPARHGMILTGSLQQVDYSMTFATLSPEQYQGGLYNDGGNGIYGNGVQGNGF